MNDKVIQTVDSKLNNYVLKTTLNSYATTASVDTKLKSYATTVSVDTKLSNYVSTEAIKDYDTSAEVDAKVNTSSDAVIAAVDKKIAEASYITRQDAIDIANEYVAAYNTFKIKGTVYDPEGFELSYGVNTLEIDGYHSDKIYWKYFDQGTNAPYWDVVGSYMHVDNMTGEITTTAKWTNPGLDEQYYLSINATDVETGKTTFSSAFYETRELSNNVVIKGEDLAILKNHQYIKNTDRQPVVTGINSAYVDRYGVCGVKTSDATFCGSGYTNNFACYNDGLTPFGSQIDSTMISKYMTDEAKVFMQSYGCVNIPIDATYADLYTPASHNKNVEVQIRATLDDDPMYFAYTGSYMPNNTSTLYLRSAYLPKGTFGVNGNVHLEIHVLASPASDGTLPENIDLTGMTIKFR